MALVTQRPNLIRRYWSLLTDAYVGPYRATERAAWWDSGWQHHDPIMQDTGTPEWRRYLRSDADRMTLYSAVFAAVRVRSSAIMKAVPVVGRMIDGEFVEIPNHPAVRAIQRVNGGLTTKQGLGLIEQHKLTQGEAYWVKRRDRLGVPVEFEIWPPDEVRPIANPSKPWEAVRYERHQPNGTVVTVAAQDMIPFRHVVDPRNLLRGLSPIGAVRVQVDTGLEAHRFNQKFFDNATHINRLFALPEGTSMAETQRVSQEMERLFRGTDQAWRTAVLPGDVKPIEQTMTYRDMQFVEQQKWVLQDVARVFELSPVTIGDMEHGSFENTAQSDRKLWQTVIDQADVTAEELTEFYVRPDFGEDLVLLFRFNGIAALEEDKKRRAEIDSIYLSNAVVTVNEVRQRESMDPVEWGDLPLVPSTLGPLDLRTPDERAAVAPDMTPVVDAEPRSLARATIDELESRMESHWASILNTERREISQFIAEKWETTPPRTVRRIIRDDLGRISEIVEE